MSPAIPRRLSVAVVGAGAAGLVATRELLREDHKVTVFEQNINVGGIWDYQEECETEDLLGRDPNRRHVHSSMYDSLRTNLPRQIMSFSDFPFLPEVMGNKSHDPRRFPKHTEVQAWLEVFAAHFKLRPHIRFQSQIVSLQPLPSTTPNANPNSPVSFATAPRWKLTVKHSPASKKQAKHDGQQASKAHHSNGVTSQPEQSHLPSHLLPTEGCTTAAQQAPDLTSVNLPQQDASMPNRSCLHTDGATSRMTHWPHATADVSSIHAQLSHAQLSEGQVQSQPQRPPQQPVQEDAHEQRQYEFDAVVICVGNYHQPNLPDVMGIDDFPGLQMHAHNYRSPAMFTGQNVIIVGASFSGEELARAVADVATHVFHSARSFEKSTVRKNITRVAMLTQLAQDGTATLQDGTQLAKIDAVIYCTGYQYAYPFLEGMGLVTSHDMRVDPLWQHIFPPSVAPTLAFVGLAWKSIRNQQFELQAKLVARALSGKAVLPSQKQMLQDIADFYQLLIDSGVPVRYTHNQTEVMPINQWVYNAKLAQLCGPDVAPQPDWMRTLYSATSANILSSPDSFRDVWGADELAAFAIADKFCEQMLQKVV